MTSLGASESSLERTKEAEEEEEEKKEVRRRTKKRAISVRDRCSDAGTYISNYLSLSSRFRSNHNAYVYFDQIILATSLVFTIIILHNDADDDDDD